MKSVRAIWVVSWLIAVFAGTLVARGGYNGAVIIDGPWDSLPQGAGAGIVLDKQWNALTLKSDVNIMVYVLEPDPEKEAFTNTVWELGTCDGRLYLGYGDLINNEGPVDIVSYDPLAAVLNREMDDVPEEALGGWYASPEGRLYVGGQDARESWAFGNFYINDGIAWEKRRTVYKGLHVNQVVEFKGRLYASFSSDGTSPVDYPFVLVSENYGASWFYEQVHDGSVQDSYVYLCTATHETGEFLYAVVSWMPTGSQDFQDMVEQLYRFDGVAWEQVVISDPMGQFNPRNLVAFDDILLVQGFVYNAETAYWDSATYALDGLTQTDVTFLRGGLGAGFHVHDGQLYCMRSEPPYGAPPEYVLYRTEDLQAWENLGPIVLLPGADPVSLGSVHNRLYIGAKNGPGWWDETGWVESWVRDVYPIENGSLHWDANVPEGAQLALKIITDANYSGTFSRPWVGPDGSEDTAFTVSGQALHSQHNGHTYWRLAVYKTPNGSGALPHVKWVTLDTGNGSVTMAVDEGQGLYTAANAVDSNGAEYLSPVFELEEPLTCGKLFFEGATPGQTSLRFQVRSALSEEQLLLQPFVGPDGTAHTFYETDGQTLWPGHAGDGCVQYRAILAALDPAHAPFLRKVVLVTQDNLDHFDIQLNGSVFWRAGEPNYISITAQTADGVLIPIDGKVHLSCVDVNKGEAIPVEPTELTLSDGASTSAVVLQRACLSQICVELAGVKSCGPVISVRPGPTASISVGTDLVPPCEQWSPVGQIGRPFTLSLRILDRYRNTVEDYSGTVSCECWDWEAKDRVLGPYTFGPSDDGYHEFHDVTIQKSGEWNLVCFDEAARQIAGTLTASFLCPTADLNGDCWVNFEDFSILADQWFRSPGVPSADIAPQPNGDGIVNFLDFALMAENWMK
jgi:hypothetical protein